MRTIGAHLDSRHPEGMVSGLHQALQQACQMKLSAMQVFLCNPSRDFFATFADEELPKLESFGELARELGVTVIVHHPYIVNPAYDGPGSKFKLALKSISEHMKLCDLIGAKFLVAHAGSHKEMGVTHGIEKLVECTRYILSKNYKTHLLWENAAGGGTQVAHVEDLMTVLGHFSLDANVGLCLDTAHLYADGVDLRDPPQGFVQSCQKRLCLMHWNSPEPKVRLGSHLDRHENPWSDCIFNPQAMFRIADMFQGVPLIMEAAVEGAYQANLGIVHTAGFGV